LIVLFLPFSFFSAPEKEAVYNWFASIPKGDWELFKCPVKSTVVKCLTELEIADVSWKAVKDLVKSKIKTRMLQRERVRKMKMQKRKK